MKITKLSATCKGDVLSVIIKEVKKGFTVIYAGRDKLVITCREDVQSEMLAFLEMNGIDMNSLEAA